MQYVVERHSAFFDMATSWPAGSARLTIGSDEYIIRLFHTRGRC